MIGIDGQDLAGKTVVLRVSFFREALRPKLTYKDRLFEVYGGFGSYAAGIGSKVFGRFIEDGEECYVRRGDIEGIEEVGA